MDILKIISRRNFLGKLLNLGAVGVLLLPLPPIVVHARRGRARPKHFEEGRHVGPRLRLSFDFPLKTAVHEKARVRMDMVSEMDEPLYDVKVRLQTPEGVDQIGGATSWSGDVKKGDRAGLETVFVFRNPGLYTLRYAIEGGSDGGDFSDVRPLSIMVVE